MGKLLESYLESICSLTISRHELGCRVLHSDLTQFSVDAFFVEIQQRTDDPTARCNISDTHDIQLKVKERMALTIHGEPKCGSTTTGFEIFRQEKRGLVSWLTFLRATLW